MAGRKEGFEHKDKVYHQISATSSGQPGFATYHTLKNLPLLLWKNVPFGMLLPVWRRLVLAYLLFCGRTLLRGQFLAFFKGTLMATALWPKKLLQRRRIQKMRQVSLTYIDSIITHDLPPNAHNLRRLRAMWWWLRGKHAA